MHKLISTVALFAFSATLFGQSPFAGTWKLNTAKTIYSAGEAPKDTTLVIEEQGDNLHVTVTGTDADGSPFSLKFTMPLKGGAGQVQDGPYDSIRSRVIGVNVRENSFSSRGKEIMSRRVVVSKDGKTIRSTVKSANAAVAGTDVFDKQ